jgi:SNF2 family DNA or RNA helicase
VRLDQGGWAPLPKGWLERYGSRIGMLLDARLAGEGKLPPSAMPTVATLAQELGCEPPPAALELLKGLQLAAGIGQGTAGTSLPLPPMTIALRDYQAHGSRWLMSLGRLGLGALLADDMGLGKTAQTIAAMQGKVLVVAPTSVITNWVSEISRFRPKLKVNLYHGSNRTFSATTETEDHPGKNDDEGATSQVTITSYALVRLDQEVLAGTHWDLVVLDEAHTIKNPDSQVSQAAARLRAKARIALTGTPVENSLSDLWGLFRFLEPGLLGPRRSFEATFAGARSGSFADLSRLASLRAAIKPFVLRRLKAEVARELPEKTEQVELVTLGAQQQHLYESVKLAARATVLDQLGHSSTFSTLEALLRLRQAACHTAMVPGAVGDAAHASAKLERLLEMLEEDLIPGGHATIVISQWTSFLDLIERALDDAGIASTRLDGATVDRAGVIARFQRGEVPVILVSLKAGGVGINLTQADHVFLMDPWWNPAAESQAIDRSHRLGQERPVFVHRMIAQGTVEEKIIALQVQKRGLAQGMFDEGLPGSSLSRADFEDLLA